MTIDAGIDRAGVVQAPRQVVYGPDTLQLMVADLPYSSFPNCVDPLVDDPLYGYVFKAESNLFRKKVEDPGEASFYLNTARPGGPNAYATEQTVRVSIGIFFSAL